MQREHRILILVLTASIICIVGGALLFSKISQPKTVDLNKVVGDGRWQLGNSDAKVTVVEFSDFQCSACARSAPEVKNILKRYENQIRFIYRHFPITTAHANAFDAAIASEIAGKEGKFWEMYDLLFTHQDDWAEKTNAKTVFADYAQNIGLDRGAFENDFEDKSIEQAVRNDMRDGSELGLTATPTFFVNGKAVYLDKLDRTIKDFLEN